MLYFANPLYLIALAGILVPIIIHLVRFRRYRKVYFSNTEMLAELQSEQRSRTRLREWLVLAARILAIAFIALAFAQPKIRRDEQPSLTGGTCVSVYIDNSFSMGNEGTEGILLEQAKSKAREIVAAYPSNTKYQLVANDNAGQRRRAMTREEFTTTVDNLRLSPHTIPISEAMSKQKDFGHIAACANTHAYIVSDFQKTACDWDEIGTAAEHDTNERDNTQFALVPLSAAGHGNVYVDTLWLDTPFANAGSEVRLSVKICNTGNKTVEELPVRLSINGEQKSLATIDIEKKSQATANLAFAVSETGTLNGCVEITDYPITFDDKLFFSINVKPRLRVFALHGDSPNVYINRLFAGDTLVAYTESPLAEADFTFNDETDLITVTSVGKIQSGIAQALATFVTNGGSLMIAPPSDCDRGSYNTLLSALKAPLLDNWVETSVASTWLNSEALLYKNVFERTDDNMELPNVNGHFTLQITPGAAAEPILRLADGEPYIVAVPNGKGVAYLFTAPLDPKYSEFVQQALFVPTVYNMALYSRPLPQLYYTCGSEDMIELPTAGQSTPTLSIAKEGEVGSTVVNIRYNNRRAYLMSDATELDAGNYRLSDGKTDLGISFNYSRTESQMDFFADKELKTAIKSMQNDNIELYDSSTKPIDELIKQRSGGTSLAKWCVFAALLFLLSETLLLRIRPRKRKGQG